MEKANFEKKIEYLTRFIVLFDANLNEISFKLHSCNAYVI